MYARVKFFTIYLHTFEIPDFFQFQSPGNRFLFSEPVPPLQFHAPIDGGITFDASSVNAWNHPKLNPYFQYFTQLDARIQTQCKEIPSNSMTSCFLICIFYFKILLGNAMEFYAPRFLIRIF